MEASITPGPCPVGERLAKQNFFRLSCLANRSLTGHGPGHLTMLQRCDIQYYSHTQNTYVHTQE